MPHGRRTRRITSRFAGIVVALNLTLALAAGCQRLMVSPMQPVALPPDPPGSDRLDASNANAIVNPTTTPPPPPRPEPGPVPLAGLAHGDQHVYDREPLPDAPTDPPPASAAAVAIAEPPPSPPTPLLDEALRRTRDVPEAQRPGEVVGPVSEPEPGPESINENQESVARLQIPAGAAVRTEFTAPDAAHTSDPSKNEPEPGSQPAPSPEARDATMPPVAAEGTGDPARDVAPITIDPDRPAEPATPRDPWHEGLDRLRSVARDRAEDSRAGDGPWALRARLLDVLDEPAGAPEADALRQSVLAALDATTGPEPAEASARSAPIRAAIAALEERTPLEINELQLCRKVRGFGDFEPLDAADFRAGHPVIVYCEMSGVHTESAGALHRSRLTSRIELWPSGGGGAGPAWTHPLGTADDLCRRRRRDYYVNYRITLPESLAPGAYELRLIQDDLIANRSATRSVSLSIQP